MKLQLQSLMVVAAIAALHAQTADVSLQAPFTQTDSTEYGFGNIVSFDGSERFNFLTYSHADYTYDEQGRLLTRAYNIDNDSMPDIIYSFAYDSSGNLIYEFRDYPDDTILPQLPLPLHDVLITRDYTNHTQTNYSDVDGDGVFDNQTIYTYDADTNIIKMEEYQGGILMSVTTYSYDSAGNRLSESHDFDANGTPDQIFSFTYDANGNVTSMAVDLNGDGNPESIRLSAYDASGNLLMESHDTNADGVPEVIYTYTYDANGNLLSYTQDSNADGIPEYTQNITYDTAGRMIYKVMDSNADGTPDVIYSTTYDSSGLNSVYAADTNADGTPDYLEFITYNTHGDTIYWANDYNADGTLDEINTWDYDSSGNLLVNMMDMNADGHPDLIHSYTYNADDNLLTHVTSDGDGIPNTIRTLTYDTNGNKIRDEYDFDGDGTPEDIVIYDSEGRLLSELYWTPNSTIKTTYHYDANGNLVKKEQDYSNDGTIEITNYYTYDTEDNSCHAFGNSFDRIYEVTIPNAGDWRFSLCNSAYNTALYVGTTLCSDDIGANDDACGQYSEVIANSLAADVYYVTIAGSATPDKGVFELKVENLTSSGAVMADEPFVSVFPSLNDGTFFCKISGMKDSRTVIRVFDNLGRCVYEVAETIVGTVQKQITLNGVNNGIYHVQVTSGGKSYSERVVVQK